MIQVASTTFLCSSTPVFQKHTQERHVPLGQMAREDSGPSAVTIRPNFHTSLCFRTKAMASRMRKTFVNGIRSPAIQLQCHTYYGSAPSAVYIASDILSSPHLSPALLHMHFLKILPFFLPLAAGHARLRYPVPLGNPGTSPNDNTYNAPLASDGSDFPCKNLHRTFSTARTPPDSHWTAGRSTYFEILSHSVPPPGEGALAAHSGGSCQASISFDNGATFKVLHSFEGGCPRGVKRGSNIAQDANQKFQFEIPVETRAGPALFAWTWTAVSGNRNEFYMNCAKVEIEGEGRGLLEGRPDMWVGDLTKEGVAGVGECRSVEGAGLRYPDPGTEVTVTNVEGIGMRGPSQGRCALVEEGKPTEPGTPAETSASPSKPTDFPAPSATSDPTGTAPLPPFLPSPSSTPEVPDSEDGEPDATAPPSQPSDFPAPSVTVDLPGAGSSAPLPPFLPSSSSSAPHNSYGTTAVYTTLPNPVATTTIKAPGPFPTFTPPRNNTAPGNNTGSMPLTAPQLELKINGQMCSCTC